MSLGLVARAQVFYRPMQVFSLPGMPPVMCLRCVQAMEKPFGMLVPALGWKVLPSATSWMDVNMS